MKVAVWPSKWSKHKNPKHLSARQQQVLFAWWMDEPAEETETRLGIPRRTIYAYRSAAKLKMMEPTMLRAAKKAVKLGLIPDKLELQ